MYDPDWKVVSNNFLLKLNCPIFIHFRREIKFKLPPYE